MKPRNSLNRRSFVAGTALGGAGLILSGGLVARNSFAAQMSSSEEKEKPMEMEVTATEDLMREHGVLRRILIVYSETARRIRQGPSSGTYEPINKAADLFRQFGEDGFEKAVRQIAAIEKQLGLADLSQFTAPPVEM